MQSILDDTREVHELWAQLGIALDHQHEMLNNIYDNVEQAKEYVKEGNRELKEVPNLVNNRQRCYCFIIIGLVILLVIIVASMSAA